MNIFNKAADKIKSMFVEEVNEPKVEIKKEVIKVEIPAPEKELTRETITHREEIKPAMPEIPPVVEEEPKPVIEEKPKFPTYFSESDFADIKRDEEKTFEASREERIRPTYLREEYKDNIPEEPKKPSFRDAYGRQKEDKPKTHTSTSSLYKKEEPKRTFKPTPIISPVYGILDKNYSKEDITTKKPRRLSSELTSDKVTIDDVRKKAYGTLEDDIETSLLGQFDDIEDNNSEDLFNDIEEENTNNLMADELLNSFEDEFDDSYTTTNVLDDVEVNVEDNLSRDYDNIEEEPKKKKRVTKKEEVQEEPKNEEDDTEDINMTENDLFSLIDSWYEKRDEE